MSISFPHDEFDFTHMYTQSCLSIGWEIGDFFLKVYFEKANYPNKSKLDWCTASISQIRSRMYLTMKWELLRVAGELNDRRTQLFCLEEVCMLLAAGRDPGC